MNKDEWESLVTCPGWAVMKQFLIDWRASLAELLADGKIKPEDVQTTIAKCQFLKDLPNLELNEIRKFYNMPLDEQPTETT